MQNGAHTKPLEHNFNATELLDIRINVRGKALQWQPNYNQLQTCSRLSQVKNFFDNPQKDVLNKGK